MARGSSSNYVILFILSRFLIDCSSGKIDTETSYHSVSNKPFGCVYEEVSCIGKLSKGKLGAQVTLFPSHRHLLKTTMKDENVFPTLEMTQTPVSVIPVLVTPTNPTTTVPTMTPVIFPQPTSGVPVTVPVTNPVTTYPSPPNLPGIVPVTPPTTIYNPVTPPATIYNPVGPPATTTSPAALGQSWCLARAGASEAALQSALDYACGIGGADCSQIQMGASCYSPITLQNHASYAFNSYYQRNPTATSCDFGGVAVVVSTNPSAGSCIYPTGSTSTAPTTTTPITTIPIVPTPTTDSSSSSPPAGVTFPLSGTGAPPLFSSGNPASVFGYGNPPPPFLTNSMSASAKTQSHLGSIMVLLVIAEMMTLKI